MFQASPQIPQGCTSLPEEETISEHSHTSEEVDLTDDIVELSYEFNKTNLDTDSNDSEDAENDDSVKEPTGSQYFLLLIAIIVIPICISICNYPYFAPPVTSEIGEHFKTLRTQFPGQTNRSWYLLRAALRPMLDTERQPRRPACVLLTSLGTAQATVTQLSDAIANVVAELRGAPEAGCTMPDTVSLPGPDARYRLEHAATETCADGGACCLQVPFLEAQPAALATMFHKLCDSEFAPHHRLVLMMHLLLPDGVLADGDADKAVNTTLWRRWEPTVGPDEMYAVMSRIANHVVLLELEQDHIVKS